MTAQAVAEALLTYERELREGQATPGIVVQMTPNRVANDLVIRDDNAFLFAVIFDQGIQAERAWAAPYWLKQRLGHLDVRKIAAMESSELSKVIAAPPALHRYINNVPDWIVAAARRLITDYDGQAKNIWNDAPTAADLISRLAKFKGIGQKKAAMATQILIRDRGIVVRRATGTEVAFDAHVRRVFLRTGLVTKDRLDDILAVARRFSPDDPGAMDLGAWYVGRTWCHPQNPECSACRISVSCPKLTHLLPNVAA